MIVTEQEIIEICQSRVNIGALAARNFTLCIDGTSCTKKTSILNETRGLVSKNQHLNPCHNPNTFFPSMIGYITSGIMNLTCGGPHFEDRSPLNVLDWRILWKIMDDYLKRFGNVSPDEHHDDMRNALTMYREIFRTYKRWYIRKMFANDINCIVLIDTNVERCDTLRFSRGTSSDRERSLWRFYTPLQNLMYSELYPDTLIDLNWFGDAESQDVVSGIAKYLNSVLEVLAQRPNLQYAPLVNRRLPSVKCDYNLENITTHTYRSIGRNGCQILLGNDENLKSRLPSYLNVTNIMHPMGHMTEPIVSQTRRYLLENDQNASNSKKYDYNNDDDCDLYEMF